MPISFLLFFVLFLGRETLFPWILDPVPEKQAWLNVPFLFARNAIALLLLYGAGLAYLYYSLRPDVGMVDRPARRLDHGIYYVFTRNWRGLEAELERRRNVLAVLAPLYILLYTLVFSLLGFDLAMSLDPHWYSTLFGAYFFMSSFYLGLAATAIIAVLARRALGLHRHIARGQLHDLGKLLFGFCLVTGDFFWSQFVVIWYGNIPEETQYIILRAKEMPWAPLSWVVLVVAFLIPFFVLLSRWAKRAPSVMLAVGVLIAAGMWLERYVLVVPSLWHGEAAPLGWLEAGVTAGFLGAVGLSYVFFLQHFPILVQGDRDEQKAASDWHRLPISGAPGDRAGSGAGTPHGH